MKRIANVICILSVLVVCFSIRARAEGTVCGFETIIVPDGRFVNSTIPASTTFWFLYYLAAGHTYSVEVKSVTAKWATYPGAVTFFAPADACSGTSSLVTIDTTGIDPREPNTAIRVSFTATAAGYYRLQACK